MAMLAVPTARPGLANSFATRDADGMANSISSSANEQLGQPYTGVTRVLQIVVLAQVLAALIFLVLVVFVIEPPAPVGPPAAVSVTNAFMIWAVAAVALWLVIPAKIVAATRRRIVARTSSTGPIARTDDFASRNDGELCSMYTVRTIVATSILEGTTFMLLIAFMMERQPVALAAGAVFIIATIFHTPTPPRVVRWIQHQTERMDQDRQIMALQGRS
jgi:hypothetical protein